MKREREREMEEKYFFMGTMTDFDPSVQPVIGLNFNSFVVKEVNHSALSGAHGPGRAEPCGVSAAAGFGQGC